MANVKLRFYGTESSETQEHYLEAFCNVHDQLYIQVGVKDQEFYTGFICLDKPTAVRLVRELKRQISFLTDDHEKGV